LAIYWRETLGEETRKLVWRLRLEIPSERSRSEMKKFAILLVLAAILLGSASVLYAAASIYGQSGLIETPDDQIVGDKTIAPMVNRIFDLKTDGATKGFDVTTFGGAIGILPNLEVSAVALDINAPDTNTQALLNAKYRVLAESVNRPSVTVGVMDITQRLDHMTGGEINGMSSFVVLGKNISNIAEGVSGKVSQPVRATVGLGTGIYKGAFAGLDMSLAPKFSVAVEYLAKGIRDETTFNGMVRFKPIDALSIDAGVIGFKDFYAGASYNLSTF
jgi:hypothetical protein